MHTENVAMLGHKKREKLHKGMRSKFVVVELMIISDALSRECTHEEQHWSYGKYKRRIFIYCSGAHEMLHGGDAKNGNILIFKYFLKLATIRNFLKF